MNRIGAAVVLAAALCVPRVAPALPARPDGPVADLAGILDGDTRTALDDLSRVTLAKSGAVLVVATVPSLEGMTVEDYAVRLFKDWGIGEKGKNNGVLLLVAPAEHKVRIEVGYGLEGTLPDGRCGEIIRSEIIPAFRRGAPAEGVLAGARAIVVTLGGEPTGTSSRSDGHSADDASRTLDDPKPLLGAVMLILAAFAFGIGIGFIEVGHRSAFILCAMALVVAVVGIVIALKILSSILWVLAYLAAHTGEILASGRMKSTGRRGGGGWTSGGFGGWSGGGGGGGGSSFGGFSGGFSGGGGASGSW